jgi:hypothetical protein
MKTASKLLFPGLAALTALAGGCSLRLQPLPQAEVAAASSSASKLDPRVMYRFFDEDFVSGGFQYVYPDASRIMIPEESGHESEVSLQFDLVANDYSGGSVCLYNLVYDLKALYSTGALQFWIKGSRGGEIAWVGLVDDETRDGLKTVVRIPLNDHGGITNEWRQVSIPLAKFGRKGVYWDPKKRVEVPHAFDWSAVAEFRIEIKKSDNPDFRVWADDIFVLRDVFEPAPEEAPGQDWNDREETIPPPVAATDVKPVHTLFKDDMPEGGFTYVYGGKTAVKVQPGSKSNPGVLANYLDGNDWSGVTLSMGTSRKLDLKKGREGKWGLSFWAKGAPGVKAIYVGLLDIRPDGNKTQSKLILGDYGALDTTWRHYRIPLKRFGATGMYWDADRKAEIAAEVDWTSIQEVRFSVGKEENRIPPEQPVAFYVDDIAVIEDIPGYVDPDEYWAAFKSDAPEVMLHDFESAADRNWETGHGPKSEVSFKLGKGPEGDGRSRGKTTMGITYRLADWCDVVFRYDRNGRPAGHRDWTRHYGLRFSMYSDRPYQGVTIQVGDAGGELFVANVGATRGWSEVLVPFRAFNKFPYYQPPEAVQNGAFDLKGITSLDFKPAGDGTRGTFFVDNVALTTLREAPRPKAPASREFKVAGNLGKTVTARINDGIFGINTALWDGDLLDGKTAKYVKAVNHKVLRYPGGLRADDDRWKEVLAKKDFLVDTDEFLDFCKKTGTEPMITVNFGKGTPQEAADWVKHVNIDRKAKVRYWEVGNELYGDWHPQHTTGDDNGKRAAEFIKAMKAVDPSILVTVVWVLEGEWNREVFKHTKDLADGVIIHHYPQHSGEENDQALLAAPQSLDEIIPSVRRQAKEYGAPGKNYQIWLTEWNSVDFKPGPQTLSLVNGLFVADYLGVLARHNIEHADYWDVHNNLTEQGGDYGYLTRTGDPLGDNVPRPSYFAFKMASEALRGRLAECKVSADGSEADLTCYLAEQPGGRKAVLLVNKHPETRAEVSLDIPGFKGKAVLKQLEESNAKNGPREEKLELSGKRISLPAFSITTILAE